MPNPFSFRLISIATMLACEPLWGEFVEHIVDPGETNSVIGSHPADQHHYACFENSAPPLNKLMVFFPGTTSAPCDYRKFSQTAAELGYHAIALKYPNDISVGSACNAPPGNDPDCHFKARTEIITGQDTSSLFEIAYKDSIEGRLLYFLDWLRSNYPTEGWEQYISGFDILWQKVAVCGHSQGGGHSLFIAQEHKVDRCITFSGYDWYVAGERPADWMKEPFATPVDDIFFFVHLRDGALDFEENSEVVALTLDLKRYGSHVVVEDHADNTFNETHFLTSDLEPARSPAEGGRRHNVAILDDDLRYLPDGITPVMKRAWEYFLTHETPPVRIEFGDNEARVYFSPGILRFSTDLSNWAEFPYPFTPSPLVIPTNSPAWPDCGFYSLIPAP